MSLSPSFCRHIKSSLSQSFLYVVPASHMFLILVDNQSWQLNKHSRSTGIWELMVTKVALVYPSFYKRVICKRVWSLVNFFGCSINDLQYRESPFINTKTLLRSQSLEQKRGLESSNKNLDKWFSVIDTHRWREKWTEKHPFSFLDLSKILHGFIVFEVGWKDVSGIKYFNQLQVPTHVHKYQYIYIIEEIMTERTIMWKLKEIKLLHLLHICPLYGFKGWLLYNHW